MQAEAVSPFTSFADPGMFGPVDYDMLDESAEADHDDMVMEEEELILEENMMDEAETFVEEVDMDAMDEQDGTMGDAPAPENSEHDEPMVDETIEDNRSENYEIVEVQLTDHIPSDNTEIPSQITEAEVFTSHQVETFEFPSSTYASHAFNPEETAPPLQEPLVDGTTSPTQESARHPEETPKESEDPIHYSEAPLDLTEDPDHHNGEPDTLEKPVQNPEAIENDDAASTHSTATLRNDSSLIEGPTAEDNTFHQLEEKSATEVAATTNVGGCDEYPYPIIVSYDSSRVLLFPPQDSWYEEGAFDNQYTKLPREFFVQDFNACDETFTELFLRFRDVLGDNVGDDEELHIDMEVLGLRFGEDNLACKNWSLRRVLQAYLALHRNDGHNFPAPLEMTLYTSPRFASRLEFMLELADEGKGVNEYVTRLKLQDEDALHSALDDGYHSPSYNPEDHESVHETKEQEQQNPHDSPEDADKGDHTDQDDDDYEAELHEDEHDGDQHGAAILADQAGRIDDSLLEETDLTEDIEEGHNDDVSAHGHDQLVPADGPVPDSLEVSAEATTMTADTPAQETANSTPTGHHMSPFDEDDEDLLESDDEDGVPDSRSMSAQHASNGTNADTTPNDAEQASPSVETQESHLELQGPTENDVGGEHTSAIPVYSPEDEEDEEGQGHGGEYSGFGEPDYEQQQLPHEDEYAQSTAEGYRQGYEPEGHDIYGDAEDQHDFEEQEDGQGEEDGEGEDEDSFEGYQMQQGDEQAQTFRSTEPVEVTHTSGNEERGEDEGEQDFAAVVGAHDLSEERAEIPNPQHRELEDRFDDDELLPYDEDEEDELNVEPASPLEHHSGTHTPQKRGREEDEEKGIDNFQDDDDSQASKRPRAD